MQPYLFLSAVWRRWLRVSRLIGDFVGRVVLSVFYFTIFAPFGLGVRLFADYLGLKPTMQTSFWREGSPAPRGLVEARRQF